MTIKEVHIHKQRLGTITVFDDGTMIYFHQSARASIKVHGFSPDNYTQVYPPQQYRTPSSQDGEYQVELRVTTPDGTTLCQWTTFTDDALDPRSIVPEIAYTATNLAAKIGEQL